jgi:hypothetical protein
MAICGDELCDKPLHNAHATRAQAHSRASVSLRLQSAQVRKNFSEKMRNDFPWHGECSTMPEELNYALEQWRSRQHRGRSWQIGRR